MSTIICPISGEVLGKSDLLLGFDLALKHPIFLAKKSLILTPDIVHKFYNAKSPREKNLYFLAVLHTMDLVEFHVPAKPAPYVVESTFLDVVTLASWVDYAKFQIRDKISFPRFAVRKENEDIKNISIWLSSLYDIRKIFLEKSKDESLKRELNERAQKIEVEFRKAGLVGRAFTIPLARWALELTDTPPGVFESWRQILITPLEDAWMIDRDTLLEIQDHLCAELPVTNDQALAVRHQIKLLVDKSREGFSFVHVETSSEDDEFPEPKRISTPEIRGNGQDFQPSKPESLPSYDLSNLPPEPQEKDFGKKFEFLQARAKWNLLVKAAMNKGKNHGEFGQF